MADARLYACPDCSVVVAVEGFGDPDRDCPACGWDPLVYGADWRPIGEVSR